MKILLITGHFPPEKTGGTARPYSLYKYLPENGIDVSVITRNFYGDMPDETNVYRYDSLWSWRKSSWVSRKVIFKIISLIKNKIYDINHDRWWVQEVIKNTSDYAQGIELIYASFPGPEVLEIALKLKNRIKVPLIVEFRDGLAFESIIENPNYFQRITIKRLEKKIVHASEIVITIGKNLSDYFIKHYNKKVYTIYNGYDESDFETNFTYENTNKNKKCLIHFGSLHNTKKANRTGLFKALKNLRAKRIIDKNNFSLIFIGNLNNKEKDKILSYGGNDAITFLPYMNKKEGFEFVARNADYLLFYGVPKQTTIISSKLLEYIKLSRPIFGICKGNEADLIIKKTGTGETCDFDENAIELLLIKMMNDSIYYKPDYAEIEKFNRKYQGKQIASIIKSVVTSQNTKLHN